jgi:hypothetical protein
MCHPERFQEAFNEGGKLDEEKKSQNLTLPNAQCAEICDKECTL